MTKDIDLPVIVEIVDHAEKIKEFLEVANKPIEAVACFTAYDFSGHSGIYGSQRIAHHKFHNQS